MKPRAVRMPQSLWDSLQTEAEDADLGTAEYVRQILRARDEPVPNTQANTQPDTQPNTELAGRVDELEQRVAALEADHRDEPDTPGRSDGAQPATERDESAADSQPTADASRSDGRAERADVAHAVETVAESWGDDPERLAARKAAATAVLTAALEEDPIGRSEAVDRFYAEYPVGGQSERTWWRKNVRPVLTEFGSYSQGQQGYVVDGLPAAEEE